MTAPSLGRIAAFAALALFGAVHWAGMLLPRPTAVLGLAVVLAAGLAWAPAHRIPTGSRARRVLVLGTAGALLLAVALLLAGVPVRLLVPDEWEALAAGVISGLEALPGARVPYDGSDPWVRRVILAGGVLLIGLGAAAALVQRGARPLAGAAALGVLYVVPVVERDPPLMYLDGALFAVLTAAYLWADRLRRQDLVLAGGLLGATVCVALLAAPRVDASRPWLNYVQLAKDIDRARTSTFSWDHQYGPLDWSREGREVLRVRSRRPAYWKAVNLEAFDGVRWRQVPRDTGRLAPVRVSDPRWVAEARFTVRGLRTRQIIGAGETIALRGVRPGFAEATPGSFETIRRPLRRGDQYLARTYVPRPGPARMREAGIDYPDTVRSQTAVELPADAPSARTAVLVAPFGSRQVTLSLRAGASLQGDGVDVIRASPYRRLYDLVQRQKRASRTPYDLARRIQSYLQRGAEYTETPPPARLPLDAFVFGRREGYCQQFSGAMALMLRLAGVPARVASGFSPGDRDARSGEWVVRDLDAHSWVEVYFPGLGWVTFDPTPAGTPADGRDEEQDAAAPGPGDTRGDDEIGRGEAPADGGGLGAGGRTTRWMGVVIGAGVLGLLLLTAALRRRRVTRRSGGAGAPPAEIAELMAALRRTGRRPAPRTTLHAVERSLGTGAAADYVRALRLARFAGARPAGDRGHAPDPLDRAALRRELGAGLRWTTRVAAWRALPPRKAELRARMPRRLGGARPRSG